MLGHASNADSPTREVNEEENVEGHRPTVCQHLGREEVSRDNGVCVGPDEVGPCRVTAPGWGRRYPVTLQNVADGLIGDLIAEIGKCPLDSIIAPGRIGFGKADDQPLDLRIDTRSTGGTDGVSSRRTSSRRALGTT